VGDSFVPNCGYGSDNSSYTIPTSTSTKTKTFYSPGKTCYQLKESVPSTPMKPIISSVEPKTLSSTSSSTSSLSVSGYSSCQQSVTSSRSTNNNNNGATACGVDVDKIERCVTPQNSNGSVVSSGSTSSSSSGVKSVSFAKSVEQYGTEEEDDDIVELKEMMDNSTDVRRISVDEEDDDYAKVQTIATKVQVHAVQQSEQNAKVCVPENDTFFLKFLVSGMYFVCLQAGQSENTTEDIDDSVEKLKKRLKEVELKELEAIRDVSCV